MNVAVIKYNSCNISSVYNYFKTLGLELSTATGLLFRPALMHHGLPFPVKVVEPNDTTYAAMEAAENGEVYGPYDNMEDLMEALNA